MVVKCFKLRKCCKLLILLEKWQSGLLQNARNVSSRKAPWVRILLFPPIKALRMKILRAFSIDIRILSA